MLQRIVGERDETGGRQPAQPQTEHQHQQDTQHEHRRREPRHRQHARRHAGQPAARPRGDHAQRHAQRHRGQQAGADQFQAARNAPGQLVGHRFARAQRDAQVAMRQRADPARELRAQRLVQSQLRAHFRDRQRIAASLLAQHDGDGIARQQMDGDEHHPGRQGQGDEGRGQPPGQEWQHPWPLNPATWWAGKCPGCFRSARRPAACSRAPCADRPAPARASSRTARDWFPGCVFRPRGKSAGAP